MGVRGETGIVVARLQPDFVELGNFEATTGWAALSNDTTGLATELNHVLGTKSIEFDKVDGAANQKYAGIAQTISPTVDLSRFTAKDEIQSRINVSATTNIDYAFIRLGTSASHYNEWRLADSAITINVWQEFTVAIGDCQVAVVGNGWNPAAVAYVCVGVMFDAETNALADIRYDHVIVATSQMTTT